MFKQFLVRLTLAIARILCDRKRYSRFGTRANLGCGLHCLEKWVNIDGSLTALLGSRRHKVINRLVYAAAGSSAFYPFAHYNEVLTKKKLYFFDLRYGVPFDNDSLEVIYSSHFIEHLSEKDGERFLGECLRTLKPGGIFRLSLPDLDVAFKMYSEKQYLEMLHMFFYTSEHYDFSAHKFNYNFDILAKKLENIGFSKVKKCSFRSGNCPDIDYLDVYPEHSFFIECSK